MFKILIKRKFEKKLSWSKIEFTITLKDSLDKLLEHYAEESNIGEIIKNFVNLVE